MNGPENNRSGRFRLLADIVGPALPGLLIMSLFINLLALATPLFVMQVYDRVIFHAGLTTLQALVLGICAVILFDFILRQARSRVLQRVALAVDVDLGRALFAKVAGLPLQVLESRPGHAWQFLFRDLETVRNTVAGAAVIALVDLPFIVFFLGLVIWLAPPLAWVFALVAVAFVLLGLWNGISVGRASRIEREATMRRDRLLNEIVLGRTVMKSAAMAGPLQALWEKGQAASIQSAIKRGRLADGSMNAGASLGVIATIALTSVGAVAILDLKMTIGTLVAANLLSSRLIAPLSQLITSWRSLAALRESAGRLNAILAEPDDRRLDAIDLPRPSGKLQVEEATFTYDPEAAPALKAISVRFGPGGLHAIVGPNGSGKTTLLKLAHGLYRPATGRVLLDDADISQFSRDQVAAWIGYVPQDGFLFSGTVRENIARFATDAADADILAAAELAGVHSFVADLPDGYDTQVGEGGGRFSTGQRQRIAIARALVGNPPIVLLDEPTSNLDRDAEDDLRRHLCEMARSRTVVMVTHSPALLQASDSITVLVKGTIALAGRTEQVLPRLMGSHVRQVGT
ncbi:MAG: ATP-binding cassette domain-containing protein [Rhodospirillaceae bacterium]|nr:ATP-binding cassette domain-containing protein [Rhodospirillaceae bacterium]